MLSRSGMADLGMLWNIVVIQTITKILHVQYQWD